MEKNNKNLIGCCSDNSLSHFLMKIFFILVVIILIFMLGMCAGIKLSHLKSARGITKTFNMGALVSSGSYAVGDFATEPDMLVDFVGQGCLSGKQAVNRLFGTITGIEGNKITILDNANQKRIVLSQADTIITASGIEMGLSTLEVEQNIIVFGSLDKDGQLLAKIISLQ